MARPETLLLLRRIWWDRDLERPAIAARIAATDASLDNTPLRRTRDSRPTSCSKGMFLERRTQPLAVPSNAFSAHPLSSMLRTIAPKLTCATARERVPTTINFFSGCQTPLCSNPHVACVESGSPPRAWPSQKMKVCQKQNGLSLRLVHIGKSA